MCMDVGKTILLVYFQILIFSFIYTRNLEIECHFHPEHIHFGLYKYYSIKDIRVEGRKHKDKKIGGRKAQLSRLRILAYLFVILCCESQIGWNQS